MSRFGKASAIALLALLTLAPAASARGRVVVVGGGFYPVWGPGWWGPYWGPGYGPYYYYPRTGNVKIVTHVKDDSIYVDGGYLGQTRKHKKFPLRPGRHDIELRDAAGHSFYSERVYVIAGKTTEVHPNYPR